MNKQEKFGLAGVVALKVACCVWILFFLTGTLTLGAVTAWLFEGGAVWGIGWSIGTVSLGALIYYIFKQQKSCTPPQNDADEKFHIEHRQ